MRRSAFRTALPFLLPLFIILCLIWTTFRPEFINRDIFTFPHIDHTVIPTQNPSSAEYCYKESKSTIIFILLGNASDQRLLLDTCAFKSAAVMNKNGGVCILTQNSIEDYGILGKLENLEISRLDVAGILQNTQIEIWYESHSNNTDQEFDIHLNYALRYAYLYKYGGKFMDTDCLTLGSVENLENVIGSYGETSRLLPFVLFFEKGHPFVKSILDNFGEFYSPGKWDSVGEALVSYVHSDGNVDNSTYNILKKKAFYPLYHWEYRMTVLPKYQNMLKEKMGSWYILHLWSEMFMSDTDKIMYMDPPAGSFLQEFIDQVCLKQQ